MSDRTKTYSWLWVPILFFSLLMAGVLGVLLYLGATVLISEIGPILQTSAEQATSPAWDMVRNYHPKYWYTVFAAIMGFALLCGLIAWLLVRSSVRRRQPQ